MWGSSIEGVGESLAGFFDDVAAFGDTVVDRAFDVFQEIGSFAEQAFENVSTFVGEVADTVCSAFNSLFGEEHSADFVGQIKLDAKAPPGALSIPTLPRPESSLPSQDNAGQSAGHDSSAASVLKGGTLSNSPPAKPAARVEPDSAGPRAQSTWQVSKPPALAKQNPVQSPVRVDVGQAPLAASGAGRAGISAGNASSITASSPWSSKGAVSLSANGPQAGAVDDVVELSPIVVCAPSPSGKECEEDGLTNATVAKPGAGAGQAQLRPWTSGLVAWSWFDSLKQSASDFTEGLVHGRPGAGGGLFINLNTITSEQARNAMWMGDAQSAGVKLHDALSFVPFASTALDYFAAKGLQENPYKQDIYARSDADALHSFSMEATTNLLGLGFLSHAPVGKAIAKTFSESVGVLVPKIAKGFSVSKYVAGASAVGLTGYNTSPIFQRPDATDLWRSPEDQLARLQSDPDSYMASNYFGGMHTADGHLIVDNRSGPENPAYFRRVPTDLYESLKSIQCAEQQQCGDVVVDEYFGDQAIGVKLRPPWSSPSEWFSDGWIKFHTKDPTNPFSVQSTIQMNLFGPPEGLHSEINLFGLSGWVQRPVETTAHLTLNPVKLAPTDFTLRQQQTNYTWGMGASLTPIASTRSNFSDLSTGSHGAINDWLNDVLGQENLVSSSGLGKFSAYLVSGVRNREELSLAKHWVMARGTGLIELGAMVNPAVIGGVKDDGAAWSMGPRAYAELQSYPGDMRLKRGEGGSSVRPTSNAWPQADISYELWSQGTLGPALRWPVRVFQWVGKEVQ